MEFTNFNKVVIMFRLLSSLFLYLLCFSVVNAQIMSFSSEPEKFLKEVQSYLGVLNKVDAKAFIKEFEPIWLGSSFSLEQRAQVYATSNKMAQKRLRAYPDFRNYLDAVMNFAISGKSEQDFNQWQQTIDKVLEGREKNELQSTSKHVQIYFLEILFTNLHLLNGRQVVIIILLDIPKNQ